MKILQVHNYYQQTGGEDSVVKNEYDLLIRHGHDVIQVTKHNDNIKGLLSKLRLIWNSHYSKNSLKSFKEVLSTIMPDIVHVHNIFPLFTPSIFDACLFFKIPVVMTIHNFRIFYPNGLFLHKGKQDMRGLTSSSYTTVLDKVYRNSYIQTAIVARMIEYHKRKNTWNTKITSLIVLSELSKQILVKGGISEEKLIVKPNFCDDRYNIIQLDDDLYKRQYFVYVGRISEEKGIIQLLDHYKSFDIKNPLIIVGEGPLKEQLQKKTLHDDRIIWKGSLKHNEALTFIRNSQALIFPSICLENFPMTVVESLCLGVPVLASNIGAVKLMIDNCTEGVLYNPFDKFELLEAIKTLLTENVREKMAINARQLYLKKFTSEINYQSMMRIYNESIERNNRNQD